MITELIDRISQSIAGGDCTSVRIAAIVRNTVVRKVFMWI